MDAIRRADRVARIDLARSTGISQATVTTITAELLHQGMICEVAGTDDQRDARRGRPRVDLALRGAAHLVAGVKVANRTLSIVLMDFAGKNLGEHTERLAVGRMAATELAVILKHALEHTLDASGLSFADLSAVGLGMAGVVDASRGFVYWSPSLAERNQPISAIVSAELGLPVFADNDANLVAVAEMYFGPGAAYRDFIVVTIEAGVGMGIVLDGKLYRGTRGCGAEFGHTKVQLNGAECRCGQRGCLEAYVADYALMREAESAGLVFSQTDADDTVGPLLDAARDGNATARRIVDHAGRVFAMGLANLINIFDPQLIILAGERMQFDHLFAEDVLADARRSIVQIDQPPPEILSHKWGDLMWARGAATYAIDKVADMSLREIAAQSAV
ncbi:ROK family transcriptional regulator [Primorskyibacter marinus]|uniref:ROK family transcriptional regulator n=1 Tax=Primorskyibacter marinus TaxID=1977320 RepID=UPI001E645F3A|nr:ROK family transcriptional regulator [Primorskyibacter marinus]